MEKNLFDPTKFVHKFDSNKIGKHKSSKNTENGPIALKKIIFYTQLMFISNLILLLNFFLMHKFSLFIHSHFFVEKSHFKCYFVVKG
jgi:uncharacterized membrane-anchored protein